ncbi:condensation domain-containing protein [Umezawaea sp. Da 62-37]|uniref:condensation domain-containing protein n=1 Tax=Umezawaea sp. Da 62-37 TaxID=3075927 RepID=UPI0028F6C984|nr:condensation domain-containing protein [Umezawaea sp. Da 62-37]WNV85489.1 condensation domain-containing protein [Umezawaea sp. Da 62-37]
MTDLQENGPQLDDEEDVFVVPTSFAQQSMWLENELDPGQATYHVVAAVRLVGDLDRAALERGLNTVVARHEALHTVFELEDEGPVQVIGAPPRLVVGVTDVDPADAEAAVAAEVRVPFDLERGPLVRLRLLRTEPDRHIAVLTMHHIVTDGLSSAIFVAELAACYVAYREGREPELPPLAIQYADFAVWQRENLTGVRLDALAEYWAGTLEGAPALALASDRPHPAVPSADGATHVFEVPAALVREVEALARAERVTAFMVFLAAFDVLLARYSGLRDITVVSPMAGRTRPEVENLIGFFVNPLLLRVDLGGTPSARDLIARARATCAGAYEHQEYPFELALEILRAERGAAPGTPQAQAMLVLQNQPPVDLRAAGLAFEQMRADTRTAGYELALDLEPDGTGAYRAFLEYARDLFDDTTAAEMAEVFVDVLADMAADPAAPVDLAVLREHPEPLPVEPEPERQAEVAHRAPETPIEIELQEVFHELLGVGNAGLDDDFFVLGGDSLSLIQLRNRIRQRFGVEFRVRDLSTRVDIGSLAPEVLRRMLDQDPGAPDAAAPVKENP